MQLSALTLCPTLCHLCWSSIKARGLSKEAAADTLKGGTLEATFSSSLATYEKQDIRFSTDDPGMMLETSPLGTWSEAAVGGEHSYPGERGWPKEQTALVSLQTHL